MLYLHSMNVTKTIAITGATSGIGSETTKALLDKGNALILLVRNREKAEKLFKNHPAFGRVRIIKCDLASLASVKKAAEELVNSTERLDVLINNAGGAFNKRMESKDGLELHFAVNHMAHFLLVKQLMPLLQKSETTIVNVSSDAHKAGKLNFDDINLEKNYSTVRAYGNAKLCNVLFTKSLADRGLSSYALHPGVIDSGFGDNLPRLFKFIWKLGKPFMKTTREGASTSIYLATTSQDASANGSYFIDSKIKPSTKYSNDKTVRDKLWAKSEAIIAEKIK